MAEKKKPDKSTEQADGVGIPIEWHYPETLVGRYANQVAIQVGPTECHLSFFEIRPPLVFGTGEQTEEQANNIKSLRADCVARVILPNSVLQTLPKMITDILNQASVPAQVGEKSVEQSQKRLKHEKGNS